MKRKIFPELGKKPVFVILIDNLRFDHFPLIEPKIVNHDNEKTTALFTSGKTLRLMS